MHGDVADVQDSTLFEPEDLECQDGLGAFDTGTPAMVEVVLERLAVGLERAQPDVGDPVPEAHVERPRLGELE
jgi:hypothetical protein